MIPPTSLPFSLPAVNEEVSDTRKLLDASTKKYAPPPGAHLYLVCFHLPVTISKVRELSGCMHVCMCLVGG